MVSVLVRPELLTATTQRLIDTAEAHGFCWGGMFLERPSSVHTIAALAATIGADPSVPAVWVPTAGHLPRGKSTMRTTRGPIPLRVAGPARTHRRRRRFGT